MDEITREAIDEVLERALERIKRAAQSIESDSAAARELLSIEKLMSRLQAENKFKIGLSGAPDATLVIQRSIAVLLSFD